MKTFLEYINIQRLDGDPPYYEVVGDVAEVSYWLYNQATKHPKWEAIVDIIHGNHPKPVLKAPIGSKYPPESWGHENHGNIKDMADWLGSFPSDMECNATIGEKFP